MEGRSKYVKEIFALRSLACLGIALYNTLSTSLSHFSVEDSSVRAEVLYALQLLLMYATPTFVFISEFLLAKSYGAQVPNGFYRKRAKYILTPYLSVAVLYALVDTFRNVPSPTFADYAYELAKKVLLADFFGYFLIVIFQFYILHALFAKYVYGRIPAVYAIAAAVAVNVLYLAPFNLIDLASALGISEYIVRFLNKVPFVAWISYFTVAFYCGKNAERVTAFARRNSMRILGATIAIAASMLWLYRAEVIPEVYSKRFDVMFYTFGMLFCLMAWANRRQEIPRLLMRISQYSFGIFLTSRFVLAALDYALPVYASEAYFWLFTVACFVLAVCGSAAISHFLNKFKYGALIVGKIGIGPSPRGRKNVVLPLAEKVPEGRSQV